MAPVLAATWKRESAGRCENGAVWLRWRPRGLVALVRRASASSGARCPSLSVDAVQGAGNRRAAARTRHPPAPNPSSGDDLDRPGLPLGGQPAAPARPLAILHRDAGDPASVASPCGSEAVDVRASSRAPADAPGGPSAGPPSGARQPAVGLSTRRRRTEGPWRGGVGDDRAHLASGSGSRTDRHARRDDVARVRSSAPRSMLAVDFFTVETIQRPPSSSSARPHAAPTDTSPVASATERTEARIQRRDRLGGVVHEYSWRRDQICEPYRSSWKTTP
jgi:hypothetical protein